MRGTTQGAIKMGSLRHSGIAWITIRPSGAISFIDGGGAVHKVDIKPLSVNKAWGGKTYKSQEYKQYEKDLALILPRIKVPEGPLRVEFIFGFSSTASDIDNPLKPTIDCIARQYGFDDKQIHSMSMQKVKTKRGDEFFEFNISPDIIDEYTTDGQKYYKNGIELNAEQVLELMEAA